MRIISLVPSVTETLFDLGLGDQLVAVTRWCSRPADQVKTKPKVGGTKNPKLDAILEFQPDLVILDRDENRKEDAEALERKGIRTFTVFPKTIDDSIRMITDLGSLLSVSHKAQAMCDRITELRNNLPAVEPTRALMLIWRSPYMTVNFDTYVNSAMEMFGFKNVFAPAVERYPKITASAILDARPEAVLFPDEPYPFRGKHVEQFKHEFPDLPAVQNDRLLLFDGTYIAWHGYGTLRALMEFPNQLYAQKS